MAGIIDAILAINPTAQVAVRNEDVNQIDWQNGTLPISNEDILAKQTELKAEYEAKKYQRDRAKEYPSWQDQLDMLWHDKKDGTTTWEDAVQAAKDAHPKP